MFKKILDPFASLTLTVALLSLSLLLVYAGTWAQIDVSINQVEKDYFHAWFSWVKFQTMFPRPAPGEAGIPGGFPMPGGFTLGLLLLINLIAAHVVRFKFHWKRVGVILIHFSLILLIAGEAVRSTLAVEQRMTIDEGTYANYAYNIQKAELAVIDKSSSDKDNVTVVRASALKNGAEVKHPNLPFDVKVEEFYRNSDIMDASRAPAGSKAIATKGRGVGVAAVSLPPSAGTDGGAVDVPSAFLTLSKGGQNLGTYLVSVYSGEQDVEVDGKTYQIALRFERHYKPFQLHLIDFAFDRYTGTNIPKNFSSLVRLVDPEEGVDREVKIWMNHPLRYRGETFFQADWNKETERGTVLQVVRNPGWTVPYIACIVGSIGLLVHFGIVLLNFLRKQKKARAAETMMPQPVMAKGKNGKSKPADSYTLQPVRKWASASFLFPLGVTAVLALYVIAHIPERPDKTPYSLSAFGKLPLSHEGRVQPLDSLARNSMKILLGRESFYINGNRTPAVQWLLDLWGNPPAAAEYEIFRIDNPEILDFLELKPKKKGTFQQVTGFGGPSPYRFSFKELEPKFAKLQPEFSKLQSVNEKSYTPFQRQLTVLSRKLNLYINTADLRSLHMVAPTSPGEDWKTVGAATGGARDYESLPSSVKSFVDILEAYNTKKHGDFNRTVAAHAASYEPLVPDTMEDVRFEHFFNRFDPFTNALVLYIFVFIMVALSWVGWSEPLRRASFWVLTLAFVVHSFGLWARIDISGRPPVTNLASSAIFIAWGAILLAWGTELVYRNGVAIASASVTGFLSLLIAWRLGVKDGDTMKVLQAVLDTNFWLATHVVVITLGYAATFLAGKLATGYILSGVLTPNLHKEARQRLLRMIYGITCFAILFSFVGTVLGGIWADQSWGRFWGWDPKENGAIMIVLANALVLHARWGGLVKDRGVAALAVFGNIITAWSWFGTNMLGVGLHSYGFMESALHWLLLYIGIQLLLIGMANLPYSMWQSYKADGEVEVADDVPRPRTRTA